MLWYGFFMPQSKRVYLCRLTDTGLDADLNHSALIFPYWSFTKTAIAICALKLVEQGKIALDAPVLAYPFSLRQLLNHTAGLPDYSTLTAYQTAVENNEEPWSRDVLFDAAMAQGNLFSPGAGWSYSNIGYMLAREVVERATDKPFSLLFKEMISKVLGLESVDLATTRDQFSRVCWAPAQRYHPGWVYHGCLIGTAADAARLLHGLFTGKLLSDATRDQMLVRHPLGGAIDGRPWTECGYALGLMSGSFGAAGRAIGHSGSGPFSVNAVYHFPDRTNPVTVASFTDGRDEGVAEFAAVEHSKGE
ncbi:MAG: serine hydrolase domain-containing protein [Paracoccaceae bacterium]